MLKFKPKRWTKSRIEGCKVQTIQRENVGLLRSSKSGFSLVELMIAIGISGFLIIVANMMLSDVNKWIKNVEIDLELVEIAQKISARINCKKTFERLGTASGTTPAQAQLYDKFGNQIFYSHSRGGIFAGYKKVYGDWLVDSIWTGQSFAIRVAKVSTSTGTYAKDPVTKQLLDFFVAKHFLFGNPPNVPLCPRRTTTNVFLNRLETTSGEINLLLDKPNPGTIYDLLGRTGVPAYKYDNSIMLLTPLTFVRGCHKFCRKPGNNYTSGIMVGAADAAMVYDSNGQISTTDYPTGQSRVICECYL
jgi:prepilin-type N-terminal cleavage/methylation domain-containing protein